MPNCALSEVFFRGAEKHFHVVHCEELTLRRSMLPFLVSKQLPLCFPCRKQILSIGTIVSTAGFPPPHALADALICRPAQTEQAKKESLKVFETKKDRRSEICIFWMN